MIVNQQALAGMTTSFKTIFNKVFSQTASTYEKIATRVPSETGEETYKWLGQIPSMREWIGDREIQNLTGAGYTIKNKDFELTVGVDRNDIEDDKLGIYRPIIEDMANNAKTFPGDLVFGLLKNGFEKKCYDDKPFFSNAHKVGKKTVSNMGTAKLSAESYGAARVAIMSIVNEKNKPLKLVPDLLVVAPANEAKAKEILVAETINGSSNIYKGTAELLVLPELAGADDAWYLLCTSKPLKPLIYQERKAPKFTALADDKDENVFMKKTYLYGVEARGNAGFGFWQMAYGSDGSAS